MAQSGMDASKGLSML